ncbi:MAG: hypothetical protein GY928_40745, partial [Colwellia sp.]|nr:hypothetical protein [Colwellia sp.]
MAEQNRKRLRKAQTQCTNSINKQCNTCFVQSRQSEIVEEVKAEKHKQFLHKIHSTKKRTKSPFQKRKRLRKSRQFIHQNRIVNDEFPLITPYGLGENYSNNYNPTLNASNDYTFQTKRDKSESNNAKEKRDSEVLIAEECIERDFSFCSAVQSDTETLSHYHQRIDDMCYPMQNILLNHPHFNVENAEYQRTNNKHLLQMGTDVSKRNVLTIPMNCIQVPLVSEPKVSIIAAADTMSDIDCMGINPTMYYRNKGLICYDSKGISVMTGNGKFRVHCYVPIRLKCENGNEIKRKFWCLENLPTYDWLIG